MAFKTRLRPTGLAIALGLAGVAAAGQAQAAVTCASVIAANNLTHVIYGAGGSAITPTLAAVAYALSQSNPPITVFYSDPGAQIGYDAFIANPGGKSKAFKYWLTAADAASATPPTCTPTDTLNGQPLDFATTGSTLALFGETLPDGIGQFAGPAQGINFIVPKDSTETSISTEALYFVFGLPTGKGGLAGATSPIPWTVNDYIFERASTSFVQQFVAGTIRQLGGNAATFPVDFSAGSTPTATHSNSGDSNQGTVDSLVWAAGQGKAQQAIGFTSGPVADKNRATVHTLAYQHVGQTSGYWPDSTPDAFDKINIRTGQYYLWDVNQFYAKVSGTSANAKLSQVTNTDVKNFIGYFSGDVAPPADADVNGAIVTTGSIPLCAMQVSRATDFGSLSCYAPPVPCGCSFEKIATGTSTCGVCTTDTDCKTSGAPACHYGFCEAY